MSFKGFFSGFAKVFKYLLKNQGEVAQEVEAVKEVVDAVKGTAKNIKDGK